MELSCSNTLKLIYAQKHLSNFWLNVHSEYPEPSDEAVKYQMPFPSTYVCESVFSVLAAFKLKY
jgi:hypothetical protein